MKSGLFSADNLGGHYTEAAIPNQRMVGMADIVTLDTKAIDFESAVDEVDILIPRYLEAVEALRDTEKVEDITSRLQHVMVYWERLSLLFEQIQPLEADIPFGLIIKDTLQAELATLEQVYLRLNLQIELSESEWTQELWEAAKQVLCRMDEVLALIGFPRDHEDRVLITEMTQQNQAKKQLWLMRRNLLKKG